MKYKKVKPEERLPENRETGDDYRPLVRYRDFASRGTTHRLPSKFGDHNYELMSTLEYDTVVTIEDKSGVVYVREQYGLDIVETQEIAQTLGIKHPRDPQTKELSYMTTDFVVDHIKNGERVLTAVNVKYYSDTKKKRFQEKLAIEREYWRRKGAETVVITEKDIDKTMVKNILTLRDLEEPTPKQEALLEPFLNGLVTSGYTLGYFCELFALENGISFGWSFYLFKLLVKRGWKGHDLREPFSLSRKYYGCPDNL